ncbi:MAG: hypothetical protein ACOY16_02090 [Chloroflexota bacterium]
MGTLTEMKVKEVKIKIIRAICNLYQRDPELIQENVNERSITHKLAEYLQDEFPEWHVDCEYNRRGNQVKRLSIENWNVSPEDTEAKTVFPDIIVHKRLTNQNLIILEVKKVRGNENTHDIDKLCAFTRDPNYSYCLGLFLRIGLEPNPITDSELRVFIEGEEDVSWTQDLQQALGELSLW